MEKKSDIYSEVQSLYELCTFSTDLPSFCRQLGVNYEKYMKWSHRQRVDEETGRSLEVDDHQPPVMSSVMVTDLPVEEDESCDEEDDTGTAVGQEFAQPHSQAGFSPDGTPVVKGFDVKSATLADVICAGNGLDMEVDSFKVHMHDGLNIRHTHITLREAIVVLHRLNIMYSC